MEKELKKENWLITQEELTRDSEPLLLSEEKFYGTKEEVKELLRVMVGVYVKTYNVFIEGCTTAVEDLDVNEDEGTIKAFVCFTYWKYEDPVVITAKRL